MNSPWINGVLGFFFLEFGMLDLVEQPSGVKKISLEMQKRTATAEIPQYV